MKQSLFIFAAFLSFAVVNAQSKAPASIKSVLLEQLRTTHNKKEWFVPVNIAVEDLTPEQAMWKDSSGNHSVGQLVNHLIFWNLQQLVKFNGQTPAAFNGNNDETFNFFDKSSWNGAVKRLDSVLTALEQAIEKADEKKLSSWYATIANISTHNAYHTGQIIFVRKLQGSWNPEKGVK